MLKLQDAAGHSASSAASSRVRGEFGYWVFEGDTVPIQRPSWNYRKEDGGGIIIDMLCHWRYVLDNLFGEVKAVSCLGATHIPQRWDEAGKPYECTADDSAYATFELEGGVIAPLQFVLVRARAPRRPAHTAGGRHQGHGRRRPARVLDAALRRHAAAAGIRTSTARSTISTAGRRSRSRTTRQRLQAPVGAVSCATS